MWFVLKIPIAGATGIIIIAFFILLCVMLLCSVVSAILPMPGVSSFPQKLAPRAWTSLFEEGCNKIFLKKTFGFDQLKDYFDIISVDSLDAFR